MFLKQTAYSLDTLNYQGPELVEGDDKLLEEGVPRNSSRRMLVQDATVPILEFTLGSGVQVYFLTIS